MIKIDASACSADDSDVPVFDTIGQCSFVTHVMF